MNDDEILTEEQAARWLVLHGMRLYKDGETYLSLSETRGWWFSGPLSLGTLRGVLDAHQSSLAWGVASAGKVGYANSRLREISSC